MKRLKKFRSVRALKSKSYTKIRKANRKRPASSIEKIVYSWLEAENIPFKKEKAIGRCHVDIFLEPNLVLEVQGCYFHKCLKCMPEQTKKDEAVRRRDSRRFAFLKSKGMTVIEIWEHEITKAPISTRKKIIDLVGIF